MVGETNITHAGQCGQNNNSKKKANRGFPGGSAVKNHLQMQETWVQFLVREDPLEKEPTPILFLRKSHGQRSLASYGPWACKRVRHDLATKQ